MSIAEVSRNLLLTLSTVNETILFCFQIDDTQWVCADILRKRLRVIC